MYATKAVKVVASLSFQTQPTALVRCPHRSCPNDGSCQNGSIKTPQPEGIIGAVHGGTSHFLSQPTLGNNTAEAVHSSHTPLQHPQAVPQGWHLSQSCLELGRTSPFSPLAQCRERGQEKSHQFLSSPSSGIEILILNLKSSALKSSTLYEILYKPYPLSNPLWALEEEERAAVPGFVPPHRGPCKKSFMRFGAWRDSFIRRSQEAMKRRREEAGLRLQISSAQLGTLPWEPQCLC